MEEQKSPLPRITEEVMTDLTNRFRHHPPKSDAVAHSHGKIRETCLDLAVTIKILVPNGREQALALTNLEQVMMWSNAGIARAE